MAKAKRMNSIFRQTTLVALTGVSSLLIGLGINKLVSEKGLGPGVLLFAGIALLAITFWLTKRFSQ